MLGKTNNDDELQTARARGKRRDVMEFGAERAGTAGNDDDLVGFGYEQGKLVFAEGCGVDVDG
jgi:hypothetical protein